MACRDSFKWHLSSQKSEKQSGAWLGCKFSLGAEKILIVVQKSLKGNSSSNTNVSHRTFMQFLKLNIPAK